MLGAVAVGETTAIEAVKLVVELPDIAQMQPVALAGRHLLRKLDDQPLGGFVGPWRARQAGADGALELGRPDLEVGRIHNELASRLRYVQGDGCRPAELERHQVRRQLQLVMSRPHAVGQPPLCGVSQLGSSRGVRKVVTLVLPH